MEEQGGISFIDLFYIKDMSVIICRSGDDEILESYKKGGVKHFKYEELDIWFLFH